MKSILVLSLVLLACNKISEVKNPVQVEKVNVVKDGCSVEKSTISCVENKILYKYRLGTLKQIKAKKDSSVKERAVLNSQTCLKEAGLIKCGNGNDLLVWSVGGLKSYKSL